MPRTFPKEEQKGEALSMIDLFKATHNSQKDGLSKEVQQAKSDMENVLSQSLQEGAQAKTDVEVVADVLTKSRTFLKNIGMNSSLAKMRCTKSYPTIAAHVTALEERLKRERV